MSDQGQGQWRDDRELPLDELVRAMATYSADGQVDDPTGGDASAEQAFGHEPYPARPPGATGDPDPDSEEGRALRPSPEGRTGPV
ncbi:MAG: hypothetical protein V7603_6813 [Micromonosporaceae bacterium]|jgi:hypothetical protein